MEEAEKTKDSRLAREFVAALPIELGKDEWVALLSNFIQEQFVDEGMCANVAIHDTDGHNPHAHIMLTVRPISENGTWQHKTEKRTAKSEVSPPLNIKKPRKTDGRSSINIRPARKRNT